MAPILAFFTLGMAFANVNVMFNRGFQSLQRPWLPLYVGLVNLGLNALLDWALYGPLGARGIVLSTSIVSAFNFIALLVLMRRQIGFVDGRRILVSLAKILTCSAALALVSLRSGTSCRGPPTAGCSRSPAWSSRCSASAGSCIWAWPWRCASRSSRSSTFSCAAAGGCVTTPEETEAVP